MPALVQYSVDGATATITLDSPRNRNALSPQLLAELGAAIRTALADPAVRVLVLSHTGPAFCSGIDLTATRAAGGGPLPVTALPELLAAVWESPKPVVARVGGAARAGGIGLIAACDVAVTAEAATFAFTEVRLGVVPGVISVTVLPRLLPRAAHELFLTGEVFDGRRAAQIGLVNSAVPDAQIDTEVTRYVDLLLRGAPGALAATKDLLRRRPPAEPVAAQLAAMADLSARHFAGDEAREGMAAFAEKRAPRWVTPQPGSTETTGP